MSENGHFDINPTTQPIDDGSIEIHIKFTPPGTFAVVAPRTDLQTTLALLLELVKANIMSSKSDKPRIEIPGMEVQRRIV